MTRGRLGGKAWVGAGIAVLTLGFIWLGFTTAASWAVDLYRLWFPTESDATWDSKVGWRLCNGAIADWPQKTAPVCERLRLCDNEGALSGAERRRLKQMMTATHCED
jgi:hypothetical protein